MTAVCALSLPAANRSSIDDLKPITAAVFTPLL
jgi:hypothetical protein